MVGVVRSGQLRICSKSPHESQSRFRQLHPGQVRGGLLSHRLYSFHREIGKLVDVFDGCPVYSSNQLCYHHNSLVIRQWNIPSTAPSYIQQILHIRGGECIAREEIWGSVCRGSG